LNDRDFRQVTMTEHWPDDYPPQDNRPQGNRPQDMWPQDMRPQGRQVHDNWLKDRLDELTASFAFCTRLPLWRVAAIPGGALARAAWAFPIAGLLIGVIAATVYGLAHRIGIPAWPGAALSVAATLLVTGCLHEDGLADTADGFGGGATREQKLDIMRDSRIGTYGVCVLIVALILRVGVVASFFSSATAVWALLASHAGARATMMAFMFLVPPARREGLSANAGQPPIESAGAAAALGFVLAAICLGPAHAIIALILLAIVVAVMARLSRQQIGGQTGDVLGAVEQISEIGILLVALH
jgi:adenosylcobinamide-GDP ribazoletransferase